MQQSTGKNVMESVKEAAANVAASAKSGMEKSKAVVHEKVEKIKADDPIEKDMATRKKEAKLVKAELEKRVVMEQNAAARREAAGGGGPVGYAPSAPSRIPTQRPEALDGPLLPTRCQRFPDMVLGSLQPPAQVTEGVVEAHPIGINTGTGRTVAHNTNVEGNKPAYGIGGTYS